MVLDNLEERQFFGIPSGATLNSSHFRIAVKCVAKLHAVGICHKLMLLHTFQQQEAAALSKKTCEDVEVDGNNNINNYRWSKTNCCHSSDVKLKSMAFLPFFGY